VIRKLAALPGLIVKEYEAGFVSDASFASVSAQLPAFWSL
jgi:hypothetical protein